MLDRGNAVSRLRSSAYQPRRACPQENQSINLNRNKLPFRAADSRQKWRFPRGTLRRWTWTWWNPKPTSRFACPAGVRRGTRTSRDRRRRRTRRKRTLKQCGHNEFSVGQTLCSIVNRPVRVRRDASESLLQDETVTSPLFSSDRISILRRASVADVYSARRRQHPHCPTLSVDRRLQCKFTCSSWCFLPNLAQ